MATQIRVSAALRRVPREVVIQQIDGSLEIQPAEAVRPFSFPHLARRDVAP
jgi:hypothetical protein